MSRAHESTLNAADVSCGPGVQQATEGARGDYIRAPTPAAYSGMRTLAARKEAPCHGP